MVSSVCFFATRFLCFFSSFYLLLVTSSGPFRFPSTVSRYRPKGIPRQLRVSSALPLSFFSLSFSVYYSSLSLFLFLFLSEKQKNSETTSRITSVTFGNFHPFLPHLFFLSILTSSVSYFLRNPGKAQRRRKDFSLSLSSSKNLEILKMHAETNRVFRSPSILN